jgi:hypothetical protein
MKKYSLTACLFWVCSLATAQVMLPAYQGVFSTKTLSTVGASNGLNFDGVDDRVISTNDIQFKISVGTLEGWIKTGNAGSSYCGAFGKTFAYFLYLYNNELIVYDWGGGGGNRSTGITLNDNSWHHIAMSFKSGVSNGTLIYIDGVLKLTTTMTVLNQDKSFTIGGSTYVQFYAGSIDDVRVWNVIRTQTEIQDNMNTELLGSETGLVAYYPLNQGIAAGNNTAIATVNDKSANALNGTLTNFTKTGATSNFVVGKVQSSFVTSGLVLNLDASNTASYPGTGATWTDISGNNNLGTLYGPTYASTVNSLPNPALYFNGNGQYANFGYSPTNFPTGDISVSVWIYFSALNNVSWNIFLTKWFPSSLDFHYSVKYNGTSYKQNLYTTSNSDMNGTSIISPNKWVCLGFTLKNSGDLQFYVNGVPDGKFTTVTRTPNSNSFLYLGDYRAGTGLSFNGYLSGVNFYNRTLTQVEMLSNYNAFKGRFGY